MSPLHGPFLNSDLKQTLAGEWVSGSLGRSSRPPLPCSPGTAGPTRSTRRRSGSLWVELVFTPGGAPSRPSLPGALWAPRALAVWAAVTLLSAQELSKITMPVIFNEPLSFLQRLTEYMEHTYLIQKASSLSDPAERMQVGGGTSPEGG